MQIKNFFSEKRLLGVCNNTEYTANSLCQSISSSLESFINGGEQFDDITMLAVKRQDKSLKLQCELSELEKIQQYIFKLDIADKLKKKIFLACDEVFSNIVNYSGADLIFVSYNKKADKISIISEIMERSSIILRIDQRKILTILMMVEWE